MHSVERCLFEFEKVKYQGVGLLHFLRLNSEARSSNALKQYSLFMFYKFYYFRQLKKNHYVYKDVG